MENMEWFDHDDHKEMSQSKISPAVILNSDKNGNKQQPTLKKSLNYPLLVMMDSNTRGMDKSMTKKCMEFCQHLAGHGMTFSSQLMYNGLNQ